MSFTPSRRSSERRVYFTQHEQRAGQESGNDGTAQHAQQNSGIDVPLYQSTPLTGNTFEQVDLDRNAQAPLPSTDNDVNRREKILIHSPSPMEETSRNDQAGNVRNGKAKDKEDVSENEDNSDYFSVVSAYKAHQAQAFNTNPFTSTTMRSSSTIADHGSPSPFATSSVAPQSPHRMPYVHSSNARRFPSSRPDLRNDSRFVSAPLPQNGVEASNVFEPSPLRSVAACAVNVARTPHSENDEAPGVQTPLPLYHSSGNSVRRASSGCTTYVQHYDPTASPETISPLHRGRRMPSNVSSSFRSAMKPSHSHDRQASLPFTTQEATATQDQHQQQDAVQGQRDRPNSGLGETLTNIYERVMGSGKQNGVQQQAQQKPDDAPPPFDPQREHSISYILGRDDEPMEPDDPRITGMRRKSADLRRDAEYALRTQTMFADDQSSQSGSSTSTEKQHRQHARGGIAGFIDPIKNSSILNGGLGSKHEKRMRKYHSSVLAHIDERRRLVLKMARALMFFGAPSHRVESQLNALSSVLDVDAQFIHFPGIVIANFGDFEASTSQCHFVKSKTMIALGRLTELHNVYKAILADNMTVLEAAQTLDVMLKATPEWSNLSRILFSIVKCGMMAPINFGGSFVDIWISALFGGLLTFSQLCLAGNNQLFSNTFDIAAAILFSFLSRLLSAKSVFCYEAIASSGLISLLPGYAVLCASLELASKNMMAGSVRMVYAIIYSLFLGFAIAIGSELYYFVDPAAREVTQNPLAQQATQIVGSFVLANQTTPHWTGSFMFTNTTSNAVAAAGSIVCARQPDWPWWRQTVPPVSKAATVPIFSLLSCLSFLLPLKSREVPVSVVIACIGFASNALANKYIFDRSDVVSAIGSFVIGVLGNAYSRIWNATAFTAITVAVNFLVPTGMAMAGGLAMTYKGSDGDLYTNGLSLGFRMVQVSIGITTGLFVSALLVHMLGNKRSNAVLFAF